MTERRGNDEDEILPDSSEVDFAASAFEFKFADDDDDVDESGNGGGMDSVVEDGADAVEQL